MYCVTFTQGSNVAEFLPRGNLKRPGTRSILIFKAERGPGSTCINIGREGFFVGLGELNAYTRAAL